MNFGLSFVSLCRRFRAGWVAKALYKLSITRNSASQQSLLNTLFLFSCSKKDLSSFTTCCSDSSNLTNIVCCEQKHRRKKFYTIGLSSPSIPIGVSDTNNRKHALKQIPGKLKVQKSWS